MVKVAVKWNKQTFNDLELAPSHGVEMIKEQLFALTGVPIEKQKLMYKGKIIKDDTDLGSLGLTDGAQFMMMGTAAGGEL